MTPGLAMSYVLPLKWSTEEDLEELGDYLAWLSGLVEVIVVDGSPQEVFQHHFARWASSARACRPSPQHRVLNGKVAGVLTGVHCASFNQVVLADDDVRYDRGALQALADQLEHHDVVIPQNYFSPAPWHARWDMARSLINRAIAGGDYPGTMALRRGAFEAAGGYDGDVLFENLELMRTLAASGASIRRAGHITVRRLPPTTSRFAEQRTRQAYDSTAQPLRFALELAVLPVLGAAARRGRRAVAVAIVVPALLAQAGRLRRGGRVFPATSVLLAPLWMLERGICSWIAAARLLTGGMPYAGQLIPRAAHSPAELRRRQGAGRRTGSPCVIRRSTA